MTSFNPPGVIIPPYILAPNKPSMLRSAIFLVLQLLVAMVYGTAAVYVPSQLLFFLFMPVFLCVAIVLWMMPDRVIFPIRAIERTFAVTIFLMLAWPNYIAMTLPGLPWITPTRVSLLVLTFLFMYSVSTSSALRSYLLLVARSSRLEWLAFITWQVAMVTSLPFSGAIGESIKGLIEHELQLTQVLFVGFLIFAPRGGPTRTVRLLLILCLASAIDGFIELRLGYPPWAYHIPSFMKVDADTLAQILGSQARTDDGLYRVRGPYVNSLVFSEFLAACTPFIIHWLFTARSILLRFSMAILWLVVLGAIVVTQSRLGLVGTLIAVGTYVPLWAYRRWRADTTSIVGPALLFGAPLAAFVLMGVIFSSHTLTMRVLGGGAQVSSDEARNIQRSMAVPKIITHPLGYGINQGAGILGFTTPSGQLTIDNYYLSTLLDVGYPGALGFYGMFAVAFVLGVNVYLKTRDRESELAGPLAIVCLNFIILKWVLSQEQNHSLFFLLLGMLLTLSAREKGLYFPENVFPTKIDVPVLQERYRSF